MLGPTDRLVLPDGVRLRDGRLADDVRGVGVPLNPAATLVVGAAGATLVEIAGDLAAAYALPPRRALDDVLAFAWQLNRLGLANVPPPTGRVAAAAGWLLLAIRLLPAGTLPPTRARRVALPATGVTGAMAGVVRGLGPRAAGAGAVVSAAVLPPATAVGNPWLAPVTGAGAAAALVLHEAAHAAALTGAGGRALLLGWRRVSILHGRLAPGRAALVSVAGPLGAALAGLAVAVAGAGLGLPDLAAGGLPLAGHAVGLLAFTTDGRKACGT